MIEIEKQSCRREATTVLISGVRTPCLTIAGKARLVSQDGDGEGEQCRCSLAEASNGAPVPAPLRHKKHQPIPLVDCASYLHAERTLCGLHGCVFVFQDPLARIVELQAKRAHAHATDAHGLTEPHCAADTESTNPVSPGRNAEGRPPLLSRCTCPRRMLTTRLAKCATLWA